MTISSTMAARDISPPEAGADRSVRRTKLAASVALGWVVLFFSFHIYWYLGGSLASPGDLPPLVPGTHAAASGSEHARMQLVSWIVEVPVDSAWPIGALVCLAIARGWALGRLARITKALVRVGCVALLLRGVAGLLDDVTRASGVLPNGITGLSLEDTTGHAHLRWADWTIDGYFLVGGLVFWLLASLQSTRRAHSRPRTVTQRPRPGSEVPRWATRVAHVIPLLALPSGLWRWAVAFGFPMGMLDSSGELTVTRGWPAVYVAAISLLTEVVALTAFGLVQPSGEEVPRWVPFFGGRGVRPKVVVGVATAGSLALMMIWTVGFWKVWTTGQPGPMSSSAWAAVFTICYAPLNLWGPALLALTWAYRRRTSAALGPARWRPWRTVTAGSRHFHRSSSGTNGR
jgi:hypothetical protein